MKKWLVVILVLLIAGASVLFALRKGSKKDVEPFTRITVEKGTIVEKALAIGKIEPKYEVVVKSQLSGIVDQVFKEVGDKVQKGEPLLVVKPEPTPIELAEARRNLEMTELETRNSQSKLERGKGLLDKSLVSREVYENLEKAFQEATLRQLQASERLSLMEKGKLKMGGRQIETVIRSPITGMILERLVNVGDPVVPLTSYQPGTELIKLADMNRLIFAGTADEIDVGKLGEGMEARIYIGALPADTLIGELTLISPKSQLKDNATVFDIEILITETKGITLRAGYSANADVIIKKKENIPTIPERLVTFRNDSAFVNILGPDSNIVEKAVTTGLSDGISIEVAEGLEAGEQVIEKAPKEID